MITADEVKQISLDNLQIEVWQKLTAKQQKDLFGFASFGQKSIKVYPEFGIHVQWKTGMGSGIKTNRYPWSLVAELINGKKVVGSR